ncbi:MAG: hypothetical protein Q4D79_07940 [Propionibacteriaceae bacterium]|nr:hypothetical protein [Propionibacteriaceae bacterium]
MLAGIVISALVLAVLAFGLPWLATHKDDVDVLDGDPSERFSDSMRILRRDIADYVEDVSTEISTPLTRKAELTELRLLARGAAMRRRRVVSALLLVNVVTLVLCVFDVVPWWAAGIAGLGLIAFLVSARVGVAMMHKRFDERAARVRDGYSEADCTSVIKVPKKEPSKEISVDLSAPESTGALWEPIPVTAPTYVSKPLVPRTVRTIDLSAPVTGSSIIPTADRPVAPRRAKRAAREEASESLRNLPRAVGE